MDKRFLENMILPKELAEVLEVCENVIVPENREQLLELAMGCKENDVFNVEYKIPGNGVKKEVTVSRCKNGLVVNFEDIYMRRRDPDCMVVADKDETDKPRYKDIYGEDFNPLRKSTFDWLKEQSLIVMPFMAGGSEFGYQALLIAPDNAGFPSLTAII